MVSLGFPVQDLPTSRLNTGTLVGQFIAVLAVFFFTGKPSQMIVFASRISPAMLEAQRLPTQRWPVQEEIPFQ